MANYFNLSLDTTAPASPTISFDSGATTASQLTTCTISVGDGVTTGYQMKIWGNVDTVNDANIQATEAASAWVTYATSKQIKLASGDGVKNVFLKVRDDVYNASAQATDQITLDMTLPTVTITGPDVSKISKIAGKNISSFSFTVDENFVEYKVKAVASAGATENTGTVIPTTNGSTSMAATGTFLSTNTISCTINGADLELASAGDGNKFIKVFVKNNAGSWSA